MEIAKNHNVNNDTILDQLIDLNLRCALKVLECVEYKKSADA
jgi:hypothetical protein